MLQANFYSLIEKQDLLEEEEDRLKCIPATQLVGKRLEREVIAMDATYKESKIVHEADDVGFECNQRALRGRTFDFTTRYRDGISQGSQKRSYACQEPS